MAYNDSIYLNNAAIYGRNNMFSAAPTSEQFSPYASNYFSGPGWNISQSYVTPNYTANMRPSYGGPTGVDNPWQNPPSFGNSLWTMSGGLPLPGAGYGTDTPWHQSSTGMTQYHAHNLVSAPIDRAVNFAQQWALPIAAYHYASKFSSMPGAFASGWTKNIMGLGGNAAPRLGMGATLGSGIGRGLGRGVGGALGGASRFLTGFGSVGGGAALGGEALGLAGAAIGSLAVPYAVGWGATQAINSTMIDPYVNIRRGAEATMSNFYGRWMGTQGNSAGGLGISARSAYGISAAVEGEAWNDTGFTNKQYMSMMDYGMQAGLYNDMPINASSVKDKTKKIASDVKRIMSVFGEKDMQEAIGILTKFTKMGATSGSYEMNAGLASLKTASALTGKSAGEILNTVGTQGQYLYQSMGMSGIAGVLNSTNVYAGMAQANRMGLISTRMLSLMGGMEGATQAALQARVGLGATSYNNMMLYNQYFGGNAAGSISGNLSNFAANTARDPGQALGNMVLHGAEMRDKQAMSDPTGQYAQVLQAMRMFQPGKKKYNAADVALTMKAFGLDDTQIKAAVMDMRTQQIGANPALMRTMLIDQMKQDMDSEGYGFMSPITAGLRDQAYRVGKKLSAPAVLATKGVGYLSDKMNEAGNWMRYGNIDRTSATSRGMDVDVLLGKKNIGSYHEIDMDSVKGMYKGVQLAASMVNDAAAGRGNADAMQLGNKILSGDYAAGDVAKLSTIMGRNLNKEDIFEFEQNRKSMRVQSVARQQSRTLQLMKGQTMDKLHTNGMSKEGANAFISLMGMMERGADNVDIANYIQGLKGPAKTQLLKKLAETGKISAEYDPDEPWAKSLQGANGTINLRGLGKALDAVQDDVIKGANKSATARQLLFASTVRDENGNLRAATEEEQARNLANGGGNISGVGEWFGTKRGYSAKEFDSVNAMSKASNQYGDLDLQSGMSIQDSQEATAKMNQEASNRMLLAANKMLDAAGKGGPSTEQTRQQASLAGSMGGYAKKILYGSSDVDWGGDPVK